MPLSDKPFLPISLNETRSRGLEQLDFVLISGDAYVDHPSFGPAIIGRWLEAHGYSVAVIPQPDWTQDASFQEFGTPRLAFLITAGNLDSMVNHYTVNRKRRKTDEYSPGGKTGLRPDRAATVYARKVKKLFPDTPVILGGLEASLRRLAHYDYWEDRMKPSILMDTKADLLVYGMGERTILEVADALNSGLTANHLTFIPGTVFFTRQLDAINEPQVLPSWHTLQASKKEAARSFLEQMKKTDPHSGKPLAEPYPHGFVVQLPPAAPLTMDEMDQVYRLPFTRQWHPIYDRQGGVPAFGEVKFSLISSRGCFGGCHFCALTYHQGRQIQVRSHESLLEEAASLTRRPDFKGMIHDVGGPTANFRQSACRKMDESGGCSHRQCLAPSPCPHLEVSHSDYVQLLRKLRQVPGIKKVFIRSGIRHDYLMADKDASFFTDLCRHHISGQLKVAPEHSDPNVLDLMGKPPIEVYESFRQRYQAFNRKEKRQQFLIPYLMASHPGSDLTSAVNLAVYLKTIGHQPEQVQDFYPTPGTLSSMMYYSEWDPRTEKSVYVPKDALERKMQRALLQFGNPRNQDLVRQALTITGRTDLMGSHPEALIPAPRLPADTNAKRKKQPSRGKAVSPSSHSKSRNR